MTRFEKEISGSLGEYWKNTAEADVKRAVEQANENATVESDGAIRWKTNGSYLMDDFCEKLEYADYPFSRSATREKREEQAEKELAAYRTSRHGFSPDEWFEMQATFGNGATVVNVLNGEQTQL